MPLLNFKVQFPGQTSDGVLPRFAHLLSSDTLAQVTAAGYLNPYLTEITRIRFKNPSDFVFVAASNGNQII